MPRIRQEYHLRRETITLSEDVDISSYDRIGKRTTDAEAALSASGDAGEFLFLESGSTADTVTVAFLGSLGGQVQLQLSGTGSKGDHLSIGTDGVIEASATAYTDELGETDIGVALEDWTDNSGTECDIYKV